MSFLLQTSIFRLPQNALLPARQLFANSAVITISRHLSSITYDGDINSHDELDLLTNKTDIVKLSSSLDKKLRRKKVIHVANLPRNITFADIKALAGNKEASNIKNIVHEYDRYLRPVGRSYIEFLDEDVALQFFIKNSERTIVGHKLSLRFVQTPKDGISKYQHPQIGSSSGRMVLIFGFPSFFSAERAKTYLDLQFELIDTILPSVQTFTYPGLKSASGQSMKRAFIVQAATEAEAHRMVRKLHNFQMWKNNLSWPHFLKARVLE